MADTINLSDVSTKDDSKLKTGGRRKHTMPTPKECNKIKDPAKRKRCLDYTGEYAKNKKKFKSSKGAY